MPPNNKRSALANDSTRQKVATKRRSNGPARSADAIKTSIRDDPLRRCDCANERRCRSTQLSAIQSGRTIDRLRQKTMHLQNEAKVVFETVVVQVDQSIPSTSLSDCRTRSCNFRRLCIASRVNRPCFSAFLLPRGAPDPGAPPCMRQRFFPLTAGDWQGLPDRVLAPQRWLDSIGPVLRG